LLEDVIIVILLNGGKGVLVDSMINAQTNTFAIIDTLLFVNIHQRAPQTEKSLEIGALDTYAITLFVLRQIQSHENDDRFNSISSVLGAMNSRGLLLLALAGCIIVIVVLIGLDLK
jgi:hypothetical protein